MQRILLVTLAALLSPALVESAAHAGGGTGTDQRTEAKVVAKALRDRDFNVSMRVYGYPTYQDRAGRTYQLKPDGFGGFRAPYANATMGRTRRK